MLRHNTTNLRSHTFPRIVFPFRHYHLGCTGLYRVPEGIESLRWESQLEVRASVNAALDESDASVQQTKERTIALWRVIDVLDQLTAKQLCCILQEAGGWGDPKSSEVIAVNGGKGKGLQPAQLEDGFSAEDGLALMQKKLPDYFTALLENRDALKNHYEPESIMLEDEAVVIQGVTVIE